MTTYDPHPTVVFNGGYTAPSQTIADISISLGRRDVMEQPQAGYARVQMWTDADTPLPIALSQSGSIFIKNSVGVTKQVYGGVISDIEIELDSYGSVGSVAKYTITLISPLASLNKRTAGAAGYAKEYDGTRVLNILTEAFLTNWSDVAPTLTWANVPSGATWANYDGVALSLVNNLTANVDVPGQYELMAYNDGEANALTLAQDAAQSGRGILWESEDGDIHYDDYAARAGYTAVALTGADISTRDLRTAAQWSEIVNDASVSYRAGTETARDEQSIILYGQLSGSRQTSLHNSADALSQAQAFVETRAYPRTYPETFSLPLHSPTMSDATRDKLVTMVVNTPVTVTDLPAVFGETFNGYVEGYTWRITRHTADLTLTCSAQSETYPHKVWYQIPATTTWAGYTPSTTKWQDL